MPAAKLFDTEARGEVLLVAAHEDVSGLAGHSRKEETDALLEQLAASGARHLVIDLEKVGYFGTHMLELMHVLWQKVRAGHGRMVLCNVSDVCREILGVSGFDTLWPIFNSREEALEAVAD